jgi:cell division protein FtsB
MNWLKALVALAALLVAGSAAYFSVTGLGILFSGASVAVMVMAGSLEFAKLVAASYLKQKWESIQWLFKTYLTIAVVILMVITSAGIFGYLSNAFQQQNLRIDQVAREIEVWNQKITQTDAEIVRYEKQLETQTAIRTSQEKNIQTSTDRGSGISRYRDMVKRADEEIGKISDKISKLNEDKASYYTEINKIKNDNIEIEREVGGFRFVADAFGLDLNYVVKFFIFLIVFVFDPLALALVIAFNQMSQKKEEKGISELIDDGGISEYIAKEKEQKQKMYEVYGEKKESPIISSEEDAKVFFSAIENPPAPNENLTKAAEKISLVKEDLFSDLEAMEQLSNTPEVDVLDTLKATPVGEKLPIIVGGSIAGYDTDSDGLIDEPYGKTNSHYRSNEGKVPYYADPAFDWSDKSKWINDQNAVNFWLRYKRPEQERNNDNIKSY